MTVSPIHDRSWYYFGCTTGTGHRLTDKHGRSAYIDSLIRLDGQLCLPEKTLYHAAFTRIPHLEYSALAWWDNTVDRRPGSNSVIFAPSLSCSLESVRAAMVKWFPWVEFRLPKPLTVDFEERIYHDRIHPGSR